MSFFASAAGGMRAPLVPLKTQELGASPSEVGIVVSAFMLAAAFLSIPLGATADRLGKTRVLFFGLAGSAVVSFLLAWAPSPGWMGAVMLIGGATSTAYLTASLGLYPSYCASEEMGKGFAKITTGLILGFSLGPYLGGLIASNSSYSRAFIVAGLILIAVFAAGTRFLPEEPRLPRGLDAIYPLSGLRSLLFKRSLLGCWAAAFGGSFISGMFMAFFPLYLRGLGMSAAGVGLLFSLRSVANGLFRLPAGFALDRFNRPGTMVFLGLVSLALLNQLFVFIEDDLALAALSVLFGVAIAFTFNSLGTTVARESPPELKGMAMGLYTTCFYSGCLISNFLMGYVVEAAGYRTGFGLSSAIGLGFALPGVVLIARQKLSSKAPGP